MHKAVIVAGAFFMFVEVASAKDLKGAEITAALSGNSITASDEVQYFSPNGETIYKTGGKRTTGKWFVEGDTYCSDMSGAKKCYPVTMTKSTIAFVVGGKSYKYKLVKGQKIK